MEACLIAFLLTMAVHYFYVGIVAFNNAKCDAVYNTIDRIINEVEASSTIGILVVVIYVILVLGVGKWIASTPEAVPAPAPALLHNQRRHNQRRQTT